MPLADDRSSPSQEPPPRAAPAPAVARGRWRGALLALALLLGLGLAAWALLHRASSADAEGGMAGAPPGGPGGPMPAGGGRGVNTVAIATAEQADVPVWIDSLGTVTPTATVTVRPQVSGVLTQVLFEEGQTVQRGQVLATIDARPYEMALLQARGTRQRDEAQLQNARLTLARFRTLLQQDSIARQEVDTQAALVRQLEGTVATDRAAEGTAQLNLEHTRITAPVAGRVGLRTVDAGNVVGSADTTGLAVITQMSPIDVEFTLPQDRLPEVIERMAAGTLPARAFDRTRTQVLASGQFTALDNQVDTSTGTVKGKARFENADGRLFPNQFVNLQLELRTLTGAIVVPVTAVRNGRDGDFVYVLNEAMGVSQRSVTRGLATNERVVITQGLKAGERVVTEGADRLKDGATVRLAGAAAPGAAASGASAPGAGKRHRAGPAASGV
jgi:membrane fusion protein, multidrug efflux system